MNVAQNENGPKTPCIPAGEDNFREFFERSVDFLFVLDERANIVEVNETVTRRLGYELDELIGRTVLIVHPEELRAEAARITQAMLVGEADLCPLPLQTKTGERIPVETRVVGGVTWDGKPAIFGVSSDISDLSFSQKQFSEVFKSSPTMMAIAQKGSGRIIDANRSFLMALGYSLSEVVGATVEELDLFEYDFQAAVANDAMDRGGVVNASTLVRTKSGEKLEAVLNMHRIHVQDAERLMIEIQDVSRLMRARRELADSERRLERVLDGAGVGAWDWDLVTNAVVFDERWCRMLGYEPFELAGTVETWERLVHPDDLPAVQAVLQDHLDGNTEMYETEHRLKTKSGGWCWVLDKGRVITRRVDGAPLRMSGTHLDITKRKRAEQELRNRERLLAGLAHATTELLGGAPMDEDKIVSALRGLGEAAGVDRVYIFENIPGEPGSRGMCSQRFEWSRDSVEPQIDNPELQDVPWDMGFSRWYDTFEAGGFISGDISEFPEDEQPGLEIQDIVSLLALPIVSDSRVWGFMGFDAVAGRRVWSDAEVAMLRAAANAFGMALQMRTTTPQ